MIQRRRRRPAMEPITMPAIAPGLLLKSEELLVVVTVTVAVGPVCRGEMGCGSDLEGTVEGMWTS